MIAAYGESRPAAGFAFFLEQAMAAAATVPVGCENAPSVPAAPNPCPLRIAVHTRPRQHRHSAMHIGTASTLNIALPQ